MDKLEELTVIALRALCAKHAIKIPSKKKLKNEIIEHIRSVIKVSPEMLSEPVAEVKKLHCFEDVSSHHPIAKKFIPKIIVSRDQSCPIEWIPSKDIENTLNDMSKKYLDKNFDNIIHIADLHIRPSDRFREYISVFERFISKIKEHPTINTIIVIAGDIFDDNKITTFSFDVAREFIGRLSDIAPVVIIPGNHDIDFRTKRGTGFSRRQQC